VCHADHLIQVVDSKGIFSGHLRFSRGFEDEKPAIDPCGRPGIRTGAGGMGPNPATVAPNARKPPEGGFL
jgi:hypothetical protein